MRTNKTIRMTENEWAGFMRLLGPEWLRAKVDSELKKEARLLAAKAKVQK